MTELIIIGGGFAGLKAALSAVYENKKHEGDVQVTLVSDKNFLVLRPRLYQNNPENMRVDLEPVLEPVGINFIEGRVSEIDLQNHQITISKTKLLELSIPYDQVILAAGSVSKKLPIPGLEKHSFDINSYEAAIKLDSHLLKVARLPTMAGHNRFVILGAGISGIELATELRSRIRAHSNDETAAAIEITIIDQADHIGPAANDAAQAIFSQAFEAAGVDVKLGRTVTKVGAFSVTLDDGEEIETASVIITAGLQANPLANYMAKLINAELDPAGRLVVDDSLRVKGVKNIFAAGDIAAAKADEEHVALMSCQHAMPMGGHAGFNAVHTLLSLPHRKYSQPNYVTCIDLGEAGGIVTKGWEREVDMTGQDAGDLKKKINEDYIYPPDGSAENIMSHADIDAHWADSSE